MREKNRDFRREVGLREMERNRKEGERDQDLHHMVRKALWSILLDRINENKVKIKPFQSN